MRRSKSSVVISRLSVTPASSIAPLPSFAIGSVSFCSSLSVHVTRLLFIKSLSPLIRAVGVVAGQTKASESLRHGARRRSAHTTSFRLGFHAPQREVLASEGSWQLSSSGRNVTSFRGCRILSILRLCRLPCIQSIPAIALSLPVILRRSWSYLFLRLVLKPSPFASGGFVIEHRHCVLPWVAWQPRQA